MFGLTFCLPHLSKEGHNRTEELVAYVVDICIIMSQPSLINDN